VRGGGYKIAKSTAQTSNRGKETPRREAHLQVDDKGLSGRGKQNVNTRLHGKVACFDPGACGFQGNKYIRYTSLEGTEVRSRSGKKKGQLVPAFLKQKKCPKKTSYNGKCEDQGVKRERVLVKPTTLLEERQGLAGDVRARRQRNNR